MNLVSRWRRRNLKVWQESKSKDRLVLSLVDRSSDLCEAWAEAFRDCERVSVYEGDLLALDADALVSPANSFGDMSGGIDAALDAHYRGRAQARVREAIAREFCGELPVGAAILSHFEGRRFPWLITAPTMRVPGEVRGSINAYLAMRAALVALLRHNASAEERDRIRGLAVPGLATGIGRVDCHEAAAQMRAAYDNVLGGDWRRVVHPLQAPFALGRAR